MKWEGINPGSLVSLDSILRAWIKTNRKFVKAWAPDVPWRYNERASLSILAGAIWRKGGLALEEFTTEKRPWRLHSKRLSKIYRWGRSDFYFELGELECEIEAKFYRPKIGKINDKIETIQKCLLKKLEKAVCDVSRNRRYDKRLRLGLLIVTPFVPYASLKGDSHKHIGLWINAAKNIAKTASAWYFPKELEFGQFINSRHREHFFPGILVLFRKASN